jgi:uncharacterized protein (DUF3084 family)
VRGTVVQAEGCEVSKALTRSVGSIQRPGTAHTQTERENSGLSEGASELRKRSKFTTVLASDHAARTTIQPPADVVGSTASKGRGIWLPRSQLSALPPPPPPTFSGFHICCSTNHFSAVCILRKIISNYSFTCRWHRR